MQIYHVPGKTDDDYRLWRVQEQIRFNKVYVFRTVLYNIIIQYKATKCTFPEIIFEMIISSTCFETEGLTSRRLLCINVWYSMFYILKLKYKIFVLYVKRILPYLLVQPSSWRWTLSIETCGRHHKLKY